MNIIELARSVGASPYTNRHFPDQPYHTFSPEKLQAFAAAVIAERDKELIKGVGEPVHHIMSDGRCIGYYSAEQVAAAVAKAYQQGKDDAETKLSGGYHAMASQDRKRIAELESTLKLALDALTVWRSEGAAIQEEAIKQIKEVLK